MRYLKAMRPQGTKPQTDTDSARDFDLPGACVVCDGDLAVRVNGGSARTVCRRCGWFSTPSFHSHGQGVHLLHPAADA